jgi:hypothetical protein
MSSEAHFEAHQLLGTSIRDLGLAIEGTDLEPLVEEFRKELAQAGITRLKPHVYLSDEWGVPFETIAIGIPFYLARADLTALHAERAGHIEGAGRPEFLRYLRHEMGHVVNYAYRLYEMPDWVAQFGAMTQPYLDEYHPERSVVVSFATCRAGTHRSIPTRIGPKRLQCGSRPASTGGLNTALSRLCSRSSSSATAP